MIEDKIDELPRRQDFARYMASVADARREDLPDLRIQVHGWYEQLTTLLDEFGDADENDFKWEPEQLYRALTQIREKLGGLEGSVIALNRRVRYLAFEDMGNDQKQVGDKLRAYTDKEKELYARSRGADLEGLEKSLESLFSTLGDRLFVLRSSVKGAWY